MDRLLFVAASGIASPDDRRTFLDFACHGDTALRDLIVELLEVEGNAEEFFEFEPTVDRPDSSVADEERGVVAHIGSYRLIDRLGAGGCGVVYLAEQTEPVKRKVALKVIRIGMDTERVLARFVAEREALALMDHPNIARVLDAGSTASGRPYFVMELVDGERITDYCDRKRLSLRRRLKLFVEVCEAIQHAHQKGVIHRDIKPSNVLVSELNGRPVPKIIDFGIAKATTEGIEGDATHTLAGQLIGTPAYMSPEQADGSVDIDTRSDIYSLGAMLCELLTGRPPFAHEDFKGKGADQIRTFLRDHETEGLSKKLETVTSDEIATIAGQRSADPHHLSAELAGDLDWIVMKAIEKDRRLRYETANGLALDVQRYLDDEPVLARPPTRRYRLVKLVRRNRLVFAAGGVALFGLLAGFGVATWLFLRERDARQEQTRLREVAEKATVAAEEARANEFQMNRLAQAADLMRQAAVFVRYNEMEEADKLLVELKAEDAPASLEAANTLIQLGNWNLFEERWKHAADRFYALAHVYANVDPTDSNANSQEWLPIGPSVIEWGEPGQYEEVRRLAVLRFSQTTNPIVAEHLVKVSMITPADAETLREVAPMAQVLEASLTGPDKQNDAHLVAWAQCALALLAYRQGDLAGAGNWARLSLNNPQDSVRRYWDTAILAMIDLKQGRTANAVDDLEEIRAQVRQWEDKPLRPEWNKRLGWANWGILRVLLREAEAMQDVMESKAADK
ncbi:MAG: serine/threonine protein kinase [Verrucomicrobiae bacterium]|nr:serine/threonine protein kinase [Verrucomicrobiae bacterium]